jgi:hypothetical protein
VTPQEEELLGSLAERVNSTQLQEKDPDAEAFLNRSFNSNPDTLYILAQTVLVQNIALEQAKTQLAQLQQARQQPAHATSFLGNLLGRRDPPSEPPPYPAQFQPVQQPPFQPVQQPQYIPAQPPPYASAAAGQPSFLRGAMQTAAGVAAGALAFEGVEAALHGIMGHPGFGGGYGWGGPGLGVGGFGMGGGFERPVDETVINNYYDQPGGTREHHEQLRDGGWDQGSNQGSAEPHFHESADQSGARLSDASYITQSGDRDNDDQGSMDRSSLGDSGQDASQNDDSNFDGGGQDDSSFDDSGSFDDGIGGGNDFA